MITRYHRKQQDESTDKKMAMRITLHRGVLLGLGGLDGLDPNGGTTQR